MDSAKGAAHDGPDTASVAESPDPRPSLAVFDIDGVLADVRHRLRYVTSRPKDWGRFFRAAPLDPPLREGLEAVRTAQRAGHGIVYLTGRPEWCRADTERWLKQHGLPNGPLFMRENYDRRPARMTKVSRLRKLSGTHRIDAFVDDDAAVVEAVRSAGFHVLHAQWMGSETIGADGSPAGGEDPAGGPTAQDVLFEIQEENPRT